MASLCKIQLVGNVGRDPETRYSQTGAKLVNFTMAVNRRRQGPDGNPIDETEWFSINLAGRLADVAEQYVTKGKQIYVDGRLSVERWTSQQDGSPRFTLRVYANEMVLLGSRDPDGYDRASGGGFDAPQQRGSAGDLDAPPPQRAPAGGGRPTPLRQQPDLDQSDLEDLPF